MTKRIALYLTLLFICTPGIMAQEAVSGLPSNILLRKGSGRDSKGYPYTILDPVNLPFFDDFSGRAPYPDPSKWTDDRVFINNTFSDRQPSCGIATFDALDNDGRLYETASEYSFPADELTSQPLNLAYTPEDNVWMSFFCQAGGLGDAPEENDSLALQFLAPDESKWYSVWREKGSTDLSFSPVMIKISDPRFLKSGFRFRFTNYATLSSNNNDPGMTGNCDQWNIDYVYIASGRNSGDTVFSDVAMTLPVRSLLKNHEAMPWKQYREIELQEMGASILIHYRNNDTIIRNVTRNFEIRDVYHNTLAYQFSAGASNIDPLTSVDYSAGLVYSFSSSGSDSALFRITSVLKTDEFDPRGNDTLVYYQVFSNYFAFDDGSAEAGYGINGLGSRNAMFAYRFRSYIADTLRAVRICFNDSYNDASKRAFDLIVWDDNNGYPGNIIYTQEEVMVEQGEQINGFYTYRLPDAVPVEGIFYVGWRQRSETFLNAGLDVNTPHQGRQFFWLNGQWQGSQVAGSVMIRPVTGGPLRITGIDDNVYNGVPGIKIWPNPSSDYINIDAEELILKGGARVSFTDLGGRVVKRAALEARMDLTSLPTGVYIMVIESGSRRLGYCRLIKTR